MPNNLTAKDFALQMLVARLFSHLAVDSGAPSAFLAKEMEALAKFIDSARLDPEPPDIATIKANARNITDRVLAVSQAFAMPQSPDR